MRTLLILLILSFFPLQGAAQEESAEANLQTQKALELFQDSSTQMDSERLQTLLEVAIILEEIAANYPNSLPGKRIREEKSLGPLNISSIRAELEASGIVLPSSNTAEPQAWYIAAVTAPEDTIRVGHGSLIEPGPMTHAGIDVTLPCDASVQAPLAGIVSLVIPSTKPAMSDRKAGDAIVSQERSPSGTEDDVAVAPGASVTVEATTTFDGGPWQDVGTVILTHMASDGTSSWSLYGGLSEVLVSVGEEVAVGQSLGMPGAVHTSEGCGLHFEPRKAAFGAHLHHPLWDGAMGKGNWASDPLFSEAWYEPVTWLYSNQLANASDASPPLASVGPIDARPLALSFLAQDAAKLTLPQGSARMIADISFYVRSDGLEISISRLRGGGTVLLGTKKVAAGQTDYRLVVNLEPLAPGKEMTSYEATVKPSQTGYMKLRGSTAFLVPPAVIMGTRSMRVELITPSGETIQVGGDMELVPSQSDILTLMENRESILELTTVIWNCLDSIREQAIGYTILVVPARDDKRTMISARPTNLWNPDASQKRSETLTLLAQECLSASSGEIRKLPSSGIAFVVTDRPV